MSNAQRIVLESIADALLTTSAYVVEHNGVPRDDVLFAAGTEALSAIERVLAKWEKEMAPDGG